MLFVEVGAIIESDEELRCVVVRFAAVGHGYDAAVGELQARVELVGEGGSVDAFAALAGACWVAALDHEALDKSVENGLIVVAFHGQLHKIPTCLGALGRPQLKLQLSVIRLETDAG